MPTTSTAAPAAHPLRRPVASALVNAGFVLVLTLLALFTFDRSFADRTYLLVGAVGLTVPLVLAVLLHLSGMLVGRFTIFVYLLFLPLAAVCAFGSPLPSDLLAVMKATVEAPQILLTTIPPVDAEGAVLVLPFALGYLAGAASTWLALRSRRAVTPVVPLFLVLVICVLFGTEETTGVLIKSLLFVGIALWWIAIRSGQNPSVAHAHRGAGLRAVIAALVVGAVVVTVAVAIGSISDRLVLRGLIGSGYDVSRFDNPLTGFEQFRQEDVDDTLALRPLFAVKGLPKRIPVRFAVLDDYDGFEWNPGNDTVLDTREDRFQQLGAEVGTTSEGREIAVRVNLRRLWNSDWLPLAGYLTSLDFDGPVARSPLADVRYNPATGAAGVIGGLKAGDDYRFTAIAPATRLRRDAEPLANAGNLQPAGAFLDDYLEPWRAEPGGAMDRVRLLAEYLKVTGLYSDGAAVGSSEVPRGHSREALAAFAFAPVGNDEQYAAFLALAANRLGVPARVAVGAYQGEKGVITAADVIAWVEVQVADGTWRILPTDSFLGTGDPDLAAQTPEEFLERKEREREKEEREPHADDAGAQDDDGGDGEIPVVPLVGGLAVLLLVAVPSAKVVRRLRRRGRGGAAGIVGGWRDLVDTARDLGFTVPAAATRPDQARALVEPGATGADGERGMLALARRSDVLTFAPDAPDAPDETSATAYWTEVRRERRSLAARATRWRRLRAPWSLASWRARRSFREPGRSRRRRSRG